MFSRYKNTRIGQQGFSGPDLLVVVAISLMLAALVLPALLRNSARSKQAWCISNLKDINRAVLLYAEENKGTLPIFDTRLPKGSPGNPGEVWWFYKELVKGYTPLNLTGPSSPRDKKFACPNDRGFTEPAPFRYTRRFDYNSYVFNGVNTPGMPNIAGLQVTSISHPGRTLLTMEWPAHAPLSWHTSRTGNANHPFYNDAESVVGFVDGHVKYIKIYYDGMNAAYTRDPIPGYEYQFSP